MTAKESFASGFGGASAAGISVFGVVAGIFFSPATASAAVVGARFFSKKSFSGWAARLALRPFKSAARMFEVAVGALPVADDIETAGTVSVGPRFPVRTFPAAGSGLLPKPEKTGNDKKIGSGSAAVGTGAGDESEEFLSGAVLDSSALVLAAGFLSGFFSAAAGAGLALLGRADGVCGTAGGAEVEEFFPGLVGFFPPGFLAAAGASA